MQKNEKKNGSVQKSTAYDKRNGKITFILIVLSLVMIGIGAFRGESAEVLMKSTKICLECIGIG